MMLAMSVQCLTCGDFIYKGTKFNMRKEDVIGENYLGLQIYRFYFKCPQCCSEITFKTDPQHGDYTVEHGAHRTAEPWKMVGVETKEFNDAEREKGNTFAAQNNGKYDTKR